MAKCKKCLHGAKLKITGTNQKTLELNIGGAVLYVMPKGNKIEVHLNSENIQEGNYAIAYWDEQRWNYASE